MMIVLFEDGALDDVEKTRAILRDGRKGQLIEINQGFRFDILHGDSDQYGWLCEDGAVGDVEAFQKELAHPSLIAMIAYNQGFRFEALRL